MGCCGRDLMRTLIVFYGVSIVLSHLPPTSNSFPKNSEFYKRIFNNEPSELKKQENVTRHGQFNDNFLFGVGSSAYQAEGAWNATDKGMSSWDTFIQRNSSIIVDRKDATVAVDFYHKYKNDIELAKQLGANSFRISISWPRILPNGTPDKVSQDGINYYNDVINEMINKGIEPVVTIYHWDLPQRFEDLGGWKNSSISDWIVDYARVLFREFGDRVKIWNTINEPFIMCGFGYAGLLAPFLKESGTSDYLCGHNALLAHARIYKMYQDEFKETQNGQLGIVKLIMSPKAKNPENPEDVLAVERFHTFINDWFLHPIFSKTGDYPELFKKTIKDKSIAQGLKESRLPQFTEEQINLIKSSSDYLAINFYVGSLVSTYKPTNTNEISMLSDMEAIGEEDRNAEITAPKAFADIVRRIQNDYHIPTLIITENGYRDSKSQDNNDLNRAYYLHHFLSELLSLISSGVNIRGYFVWSFTDVFEWFMGYSLNCGIISVDFTKSDLPRTPKTSAKTLRDIYTTRKIPDFQESVKKPF